MLHRSVAFGKWTRLALVAASALALCGQGRGQQDSATFQGATDVVGRRPLPNSLRTRTGRPHGQPSASSAAHREDLTPNLPTGTIFTIAGELFSGGYTASSNPIAATQSSLGYPAGVALDSAGNTYIADTGNNLIRVVPSASASNPTPTMSTLAGSPPAMSIPVDENAGSCGFLLSEGASPNGCFLNGFPATPSSASVTQASYLTIPADVKTDADGNVYILDAGDQVVTVVYSGKGTQLKGVLARLAAASPGVGYENPQAGYMYTLAGTLDTPTAGNGFAPITQAQTGEGGPAVTGAGLTQSATFGGMSLPANGAAQGPGAMFVDAGGNIYVADTVNNLVRVVYEGVSVPPVLTALGISPVAGNIYSVAGTYNANGNSCSVAPCGDGGVATSAFLNFPTGVTVDGKTGNVYISDANNNTVRVVYVSGGVPGVSASAVAGFTAGNIYTIAGDGAGGGSFANNCIAGASTPACGDSGPASASLLWNPEGLALDASGNLYISDTFDNVVRAIFVAGSLPNVTSPTVGNIYTVAGDIAGAGQDANFDEPALNACNVAGGTPSTNCGDGGPATQGYLFYPSGLAFDSFNNVYIADAGDIGLFEGDSVIREVVGIPVGVPQTIENFPQISDQTYSKATITLAATASSGLPVTYSWTGPVTISNSVVKLTGAGAATITARQAGGIANGQFYSPASSTVDFTIAKAGVTVSAVSIPLGQGSPVPDFSHPATPANYIFSNLVNPNDISKISGSPVLSTTYTPSAQLGQTFPIVITAGTLTSPDYTFTVPPSQFVNGTITVQGTTPQTISFPPVPASEQVYGTVFTPAATATPASNPPRTVTFTSSNSQIASISASGTVVSLVGVGSVTITANQPGNGTYAPAPPVAQILTVTQAPLTVAANNATVVQFRPIPALTYNVSGFVNNDTLATATSGQPVLTPSTTSTATLGPIPILIAKGTFTAPNYAPTFVPGTLTVIPGEAQMIQFAAPPSTAVYGTTIPLSATASSGLPVTLTVKGPGKLVGSSVEVVGVGTVTVTASQGGNDVYAAAPSVSATIAVTPATLTITATSFTEPVGSAVPTLTYTITGFVNGDTGQVISGAPILTTTDQGLLTPPGTYPINVDVSQMTAANYVFNPVNGSITITPGNPPDYTITANPTSLTMIPGQVQQVTIFAVPTNGYVNKFNATSGTGGISFSCGSLPANVTCTFSPAVVSVNGASSLTQPVPGGGQTTTLTIDASGATATSLSSQGEDSRVMPAALFLLPGAVAGALLTWQRRRFAKAVRVRQWLILLVLLSGLMGMGACGYSNSQNTSSFAKPGTTAIVVQADGAPSTSSPTGPTGDLLHSLTITVTVQ